MEPSKSPVLSGGQKGAHKIDGVGAGFVVPLWQEKITDRIEKVSTEEAIVMAIRPARKEGLFAETSTGGNVIVGAGGKVWGDHRAEFVGADHRGVLGRVGVEADDPRSFGAKSGSLLVIHERVRRRRTLSGGKRESTQTKTNVALECIQGKPMPTQLFRPKCAPGRIRLSR